jgi:Protein of unknown function (DUF3119)
LVVDNGFFSCSSRRICIILPVHTDIEELTRKKTIMKCWILGFIYLLSYSTVFVAAFTTQRLTTKNKSQRDQPYGKSNAAISATALRAKSTNFLENILSSFQTGTTPKEVEPTKYENVIIEPDFRVAALFLGIGLLLDTIPYIQLTLGPIVTLLGVLFLVQTLRIRFVFDETNNFELKTITPLNSNDDVASLQQSGENVIVGGANRWDCKTIVNYDFFPRSLMDSPFFGQPILIYFKETQTPSDTWNEGPGKIANDSDKVANGSVVPGQVHFFPAICNAQQIEQEFMKRNCKKITP